MSRKLAGNEVGGVVGWTIVRIGGFNVNDLRNKWQVLIREVARLVYM